MVCFVIMDPENNEETMQIHTDNNIKSDASHHETKPDHCFLLKKEKVEEEQSETVSPTETTMFDCVSVKQEFPEDNKEIVDPGGRKAPLAAARDSVSERLVPSTCDDLSNPESEPLFGPETDEQVVLNSNGTKLSGETKCFDDDSHSESCSLDFTGLRRHSEDEGEKFACSSCPTVFESKYSLIKHVSVHMDSADLTPYMCELCGEVLDFEEQLTEHIIRVHKSRVSESEDSDGDHPLVSDYCATVYTEDCAPLDMSKGTNRKSVRIKSSAAQENKSGLKCTRCKKIFKRAQDLSNHKCITGSGPGRRRGRRRNCASPDAVETCDRLPTAKARIRQRGDQKAYPCDLCGKSFPKPSQLIYHMRTHTGERPYDCNVCGKKFAKQGHLTVHNRSHTGERPFACDVCGKTFTESCKRNRHLLSHRGDKPYVCNICGKSYSASSSLSSHKRIHTGNNLLECDVCGKSFPRPSVLQMHLRIHTGEKPHKCHICEKSFAQIGNLKRHVETHVTGKLQMS